MTKGSSIVAGQDLDAGKDRDLRTFHFSIAVVCAMAAFGRAVDVLPHPEFPALLTSLFDNPQQLPLPFKLLISSIHLYMNAFHHMNFAFNLMALMYYYYGFVSLVRPLRFADPKSHGIYSLRSVARAQRIARLHRELYVMQIVSNSIFGMFIFVIEITAVLFSTLNFFEAVAYSNFRGLPVGLLTSLVAFILFRTMADVYEESELARQSWRSVRVKWFVKFSRSARPLAANVNSFYFADRNLLLTILHVIANSTATLILTYRS